MPEAKSAELSRLTEALTELRKEVSDLRESRPANVTGASSALQLLLGREPTGGVDKVHLYTSEPDIHGCEAKWIYHLENAAFFREGISPLGDGKRIGEIKWQQDFMGGIPSVGCDTSKFAPGTQLELPMKRPDVLCTSIDGYLLGEGKVDYHLYQRYADSALTFVSSLLKSRITCKKPTGLWVLVLDAFRFLVVILLSCGVT